MSQPIDVIRDRAIVLAYFAVLCAGLAAAQDKPPYPPLGKMVGAGGYRVHVYCTGQGTPTVVVAGAFSFDWALVQPEVAKFARICTYDAAGSAWSEPGPALTCADRVGEIHKLLGNAGIKAPYVLVGFSLGALVSRFYSSRYPSEVAGMVIVDHAFQPRGDASPIDASPPAATAGDSAPVLISKTPIVLTAEDASHFDKLPVKSRELHRWAASRPALPGAETADDCLAQLGAAAPGRYPLGSMPLMVVSTGNETPGYSELQTEILSLSRNSKQFMAESSFHSVEIDQPEVVIAAIRQAVEAARRRVH